ncbi:MAG TPA: periplasmic heavy metal sensor [Syntrophobacteraceae bacterium]|nr:periplasmic heavy metal sensor [Syntrophobacteraceae bacterium]
MDVASFSLGFVAALLLVGLILGGTCVYLGRIRSGRRDVKGYLDLIPDLSREQRERVQEIRRSFLPRVQTIRDNLRRERAELAGLLFEEPVDRSRIFAVAREILLHQSDLENEVIEHILEEQELLTPSQKRKFHSIIVEQFSSGGLGVHDVRGRQ